MNSDDNYVKSNDKNNVFGVSREAVQLQFDDFKVICLYIYIHWMTLIAKCIEIRIV